MARRSRITLPHLVRHVMSRGNGQMQIFLDDTDYRMFTYMLGSVVEEFDMECWNYCLMPNHYHATIRPHLPNISDAMQKLNGDYAQWWNRRHGRVGHAFQGRFKSPIVQENTYLAALSRYVALNPVRAALVSRAQDWPWASYPAIAGLVPAPAFLSVSLALRMFGETDDDALRARFLEFVNEGDVAGPLDDRFRSNERIVGDHDFKQRVKSELKKQDAGPPTAAEEEERRAEALVEVPVAAEL